MSDKIKDPEYIISVWTPQEYVNITRIEIAFFNRTEISRESAPATWRRENARNEGTLWIRGHHSNDSPEVKALLVAFALSRNDV